MRLVDAGVCPADENSGEPGVCRKISVRLATHLSIFDSEILLPGLKIRVDGCIEDCIGDQSSDRRLRVSIAEDYALGSADNHVHLAYRLHDFSHALPAIWENPAIARFDLVYLAGFRRENPMPF